MLRHVRWAACDERIRQKALALEQAQYEVSRARRHYDAVDPSNRLVAAELERRWNHALTNEAEMEAELVILRDQKEQPITKELKRDLLSFARDPTKLWDNSRSFCSLRNNHAIPVYREGERQARSEMSVSLQVGLRCFQLP